MARTYRNLDFPINPEVMSDQYSSLHTLYPGEPMLRNDIPDRYYIPHSDPEMAKASFDERRRDTIAASKRLEELARVSAGPPEDKTTIHAVEDPSIIVEDPSLAQLSTQAPVAFNDGMQTVIGPETRPNREHFGPDPSLSLVPNSEARSIMQKSNVSEKDRQHHGQDIDVAYVLIFLGFLALCMILAGVIVGMKK